MATIRRGALELDLPDNVSIAEERPDVGRRRRGGADAVAPTDVVPPDVVAQALADQLTVVDTVPLEVSAGAPAPRRRGPAPSALMRVDVAPDEHAVVLVEQDGYYSWITGAKEAPSPATRRGPSTAIVTFEIPLDTKAPGGASPKRGPISDALIKPVTTIVFRFAARLVIGQLVKRLERAIEPGVVTIDQVDPVTWTKLADPKTVPLPTDRRARVLLLVHGTFSSTRGGFGSFIGTDAGKHLLERAVADYDAVLGFDHRTLSEDPLENAEQLLTALRALPADAGVDIDVVTHSRGALVVRSLVEHALEADDRLSIGKVVMVAGPNAGTLLASPKNWKTLVDLYTNLAVGICRVIGIAAPPAATVTTILRESLQALAILVKAIVAEAADEQRVPGLGAMVPGGRFITDINRSAAAGHPIAAAYYTVSSDFEVTGLSGPRELPDKLKRLVADGFVDQLMGEANDLVVDVKSMTAVDPGTPGLIHQSFALGDNPTTYHCSYFVDQSVLEAIEGWLLGRPDTDASPGADAFPVGQMVNALPDFVDTNFAMIDAYSPVNIVTRQLRDSTHDFAVVRDLDADGQVVHYAFTTDEFLGITGAIAPELSQLSLTQTGALTDTVPSPATSSIRIIAPRPPAAASPWASRTVVLLDGSPVGVVPPTDVLDANAGRRRRGGQEEALALDDQLEEAAQPTVQAYFRAETDAVISTTEESLVLVDIALEALEGLIGPNAKGGSADIDSTKPITVHVVPRINLSINGDKHATVKPPVAGEPRSLRFSVTGTRPGPGQLLVIAGQGPVDLVKLVLDVTVVNGQPADGGRAAVCAALPTVTDAPNSDQLIIDENTTVAMSPDGQREVVVDTKFDVRFRSETLDLELRDTTDTIKGDRLDYVTKLYKQIEADWGTSAKDATAFNRALRAYGGQLFDELLPESIQRQLWDNRDKIKQIQVNSVDPFIPWEIVHLKGPDGKLPTEELFLANMGLVRWIDNARIAPQKVEVRSGHANAITPSYPEGSGWSLAEAANEFDYLESAFGATRVEADVETIMTLLEQPGQFDLLHFAGHGMADAGDIANAGLIIQVRNMNGRWEPVSLSPTLVEQYARLRIEKGNRPLVFLNACQVGRAGYQLTRVGGFAQAFLKAGAGIFVSTLWSVVDEPARIFTEEFYGELIAGKTVAQATVAARQKCRAAGDPTWLAYVVYGRPDGRLIKR
jgi:hypothetical protein